MSRPADDIRGMRLLVTGVNGFLGCHLAAVAQRGGAHVFGVDLPGTTPRADRIRQTLGGESFPLAELPGLDAAGLASVLDEAAPDAVIHLAGVTARGNAPALWTEAARGNVLPVAALLEALLDRPEDKRPVFVMPGSQMEYGLAPMPWTEDRRPMPANPYGATKLAATELVLAAERSGALRAGVARLPLAYGPGQPPSMLIPEIIVTALRGNDVPLTQGLQRRRFLYAPDAARLLLELAARLRAGDAVPPLVNGPAGPPCAVVDIARALLELLGNPVALRVGALPERPDESAEAWPDTTLAESLGIAPPTEQDDALRRTVNWYRDHPWFSESPAP